MTIEFPHDNPELWYARAPMTALPLLVVEESLACENEVDRRQANDLTDSAPLEAVDPPTELPEPAVLAEMDPDRSAANDQPVFEPMPAKEPEPAPTEPAVLAQNEVDRSVHDDPAVSALEEDPEVEVIEFDDEDFAAIENESIPPPPPPDLFQIYVRTLVEVALAAGAPGRVVEALPGMLGHARLDARSLDDATIESLVAAGLLARSESGAVIRADAFVATAQAWRATLLGEEADFSACSTMLDEWSANLIATLAGAPHQREALRRDLRSRGVAAFGLLVEAA